MKRTLMVSAALVLMAGCDSMTGPDILSERQASPSHSEATSYEVILLQGGAGSAVVIGDEGIIVGQTGDGVSGYPVARWLAGEAGVTGPEELGTLPYPFHEANQQRPAAINSGGTVVGTAFGGKGGQYFGAWVYTDEMKMLPVFEGDTYMSAARDINDHGIIVGGIEFDVRASDGTVTDRLKRGAVWVNTDDEPLLLPPLEGHHVSSAGSINSDGLVTGYSYAEADYVVYVYVTWRIDGAGEVTEGPHELEAGFRPGRVNNAGDIAGSQEKPGGGTGAALMRSGQVLALAPLSTKDEHAGAGGIGEEGPNGMVRIVGRSGSRATLWTIDTSDEVRGPTELPLPSGSFYQASAESVNADGWIVGSSTPRNGGSRPVLWRPVQGDGGGEPPPPGDGPTASFEYSCGNSPTCQFTDTSTEGGAAIESRDWASGDQTDNGSQVSFTFGTAGDHVVSLTITDADGDSDQASKTVKCRDHRVHGLRCS